MDERIAHRGHEDQRLVQSVAALKAQVEQLVQNTEGGDATVR